MGELKKQQPPMTIDEQVENLKSIGLIVDDEEYLISTRRLYQCMPKE